MADTTSVTRTRALLRSGISASSPAPGVLDAREPESRSGTAPTAVGRLMTFSPLASIYERAWRPLFRLWMGASGPTVDEELTYAVRDLALLDSSVRTVVDVACGPGNFTRSITDALLASGTSDALIVGVDASEPMIARAARDTTDLEHTAYVLADARSLPFEDSSVDAVCCYAALYLVPEPFRVLDELIRIVRPGGRIALMTTVRRGPDRVGAVTAAAAHTVGLEVFGRDDITAVLRSRGFRHIEQRVHGAAQFVTGQA